jgi:hypothetical protein
VGSPSCTVSFRSTAQHQVPRNLVLWSSLECSPPCQGGGRGFKSRQDRSRERGPHPATDAGLSHVTPTAAQRARAIAPGPSSCALARRQGGTAVLTAPPSPGTQRAGPLTPCPPSGGGVWRRPRDGMRRVLCSGHTCRPPAGSRISPDTVRSATGYRSSPWSAAPRATGTPKRTRHRVPTAARPSTCGASSTRRGTCDGCHRMSFQNVGSYRSHTTGQFNMCNCTSLDGLPAADPTPLPRLQQARSQHPVPPLAADTKKIALDPAESSAISTTRP